ncbi:uncharacterized protein PV09_05170 [Verruconis gallopava]|uniref:Glycosylphosphatidylinositol anchor biosynthesis protein 11 n=1 Tax=Verruconis gallopava TaxID=253628 RepID=A0A0D2AXG6_9PEZI|nr:uncharacterized protein PV09_05170 [Verruconis gallopava]KIW03874.1 hypothetical protein PV09_05170 [Verruconis gallopava]
MSASTPLRQQTKLQYSPVSLLDTDVARLYAHIHPITLLSIYFLSFKLIVADPISALSSLLLPLATLQAAYVVVCFPPTGSHAVPGHKSGGPAKGGALKKGAKTKGEITLGMRVIPALISLLLSLSLGTPLFLFLTVLFGAPITTHIPHTVLLAAHLSLLTALPIIYTRGIDRSTWRAVGALLLPIDETFGAAVGACLGAWVGAVPIPLDWDRDWQRWPVTVLTGAYVGWAVGKTVGAFLFKGAIINLGP